MVQYRLLMDGGGNRYRLHTAEFGNQFRALSPRALSALWTTVGAGMVPAAAMEFAGRGNLVGRREMSGVCLR